MDRGTLAVHQTPEIWTLNWEHMFKYNAQQCVILSAATDGKHLDNMTAITSEIMHII